MAEIYGQRWTSAYGEDPAGGAAQTWARGLAGLGQREIAAGVERCLTGALDWPPTLPEFRKLCLGIPQFEIVADQIRRNAEPITPFRRLMWAMTDTYAYRHAAAADATRILRTAYEAAKDHVMAGHPMPDEPTAVIEQQHEKPKPAAPEVARAALDAIASVLGESTDTNEESQ